MKTLRVMAFLAVAGIAAGFAAETTASAPVTMVSDVEAAIPDPVKALGTPTMAQVPTGIRMAVSATSASAQDRVIQGLHYLHGGWEFEASRHFAAAMREDPECLLAHWGMVMCLLNPTPETGEARNAATDRMLALIEMGKGTELERGYAYGLVKYIEEGPVGAASAFRKVARKFPNEIQAAVFAALFSRSGYDATGDPTPGQVVAEEALLELVEKHPGNPIPLNALLMIRAEAPEVSESLTLARQLCQLTPDYPPAFHLLGHYEWRCGNHGEAASAFGRASTFYQNWMAANEAGVADCPEWARAECYRVVALLSKGDFDTAYAAARQVAATPLPVGRPASPGTRFLLWDAKTLPARILIHRGLREHGAEAALSLPDPKKVLEYRKHSLAYWWIDGLRFALEAHRLINEGKADEARAAVAALTKHGEMMAETRNAAAASGEHSQWLRAFRAMEVLASDVRGALAMTGPENLRATAYNWYASAADRQRPSPMLYPPMILTPMAERLGDFFLTTKKPADAVSAFQRALAAFPNDMNSLVGLKSAYEVLGQSDKADETAKNIEALKSQ